MVLWCRYFGAGAVTLHETPCRIVGFETLAALLPITEVIRPGLTLQRRASPCKASPQSGQTMLTVGVATKPIL